MNDGRERFGQYYSFWLLKPGALKLVMHPQHPKSPMPSAGTAVPGHSAPEHQHLPVWSQPALRFKVDKPPSHSCRQDLKKTPQAPKSKDVSLPTRV